MTNLSLVFPIFAYDVWLLLQIAVGHGTENVKVNVDNTIELGEERQGMEAAVFLSMLPA